MKVVIVSFFQSNNLGDLLLAQAISQQYPLDDVLCVPFGGWKPIRESARIACDGSSREKMKNRSNTYIRIASACYRIRHIVRRMFASTIKKADVLLIGGGNMLMDREIVPHYTYLFYEYVWCAHHYHVPVYVMPSGVGPLANKRAKSYIRKAIPMCHCVAVRDVYSASVLREAGVASAIEVVADPAFIHTFPSQQARAGIVINLCDYRFCIDTTVLSEDEYVHAWDMLITAVSKAFPAREIALFSTEGNDYDVIKEVCRRVNRAQVQWIPIGASDELHALYSRARVLVGMRMHALILGMLNNVATIGIAWQGKVEALFESSGRGNALFRISELPSRMEDIVQRLMSLYNDSDREIMAQNAYVQRQRDRLIEYFHTIRQDLSQCNVKDVV